MNRYSILRAVIWVAAFALSFLTGVGIALVARRLDALAERETWRVPFRERV